MLKRGDVILEDKSANKQIDEGNNQDQAVAVCSAMFDDQSRGNTMDKSIIRQQAMDLF